MLLRSQSLPVVSALALRRLTDKKRGRRSKVSNRTMVQKDTLAELKQVANALAGG